MNGREMFAWSKPLIIMVSYMLRYLPQPICNIIWSLTCPFEGIFSVAIRYLILKAKCRKCGDNVFVGRGVSIKNIHGLCLGSNISIHANSYIDAAGNVIIGSDVSIAHNSSIVSFEHTFLDITKPIKYNPIEFGKVVIKNDVWIGCGVRILAGSHIESRTIVAAGAIVKSKLEGEGIYAGVPCELKKKI